MNFAAKTEKQLNEERLIPAGVYPFEVMTAEDKQSKKGNDMIEMEIRVFMPDGKERRMTDWIMEKMAFKLFHFCAYTGLSVKYENGTLQSHDCIGRSGYVKVGIQADKAGQYPDRNSVEDYVRAPQMKGADVVASKPAPANDAPMVRNEALDEDVPF